jgi:hypothetical protein
MLNDKGQFIAAIVVAESDGRQRWMVQSRLSLQEAISRVPPDIRDSVSRGVLTNNLCHGDWGMIAPIAMQNQVMAVLNEMRIKRKSSWEVANATH